MDRVSLCLLAQVGNSARIARLTIGNLPSLSTRSVVDATLAPLRDRSYSISRRLTCGNIDATCSMRSAGTRRPLLLLLEAAELEEGLVKKKYRMAKTEMTAKTSRDGMFKVVGSDGEDEVDMTEGR